jgi:hypothetical protein
MAATLVKMLVMKRAPLVGKLLKRDIPVYRRERFISLMPANRFLSLVNIPFNDGHKT